ncbi:C-type mannose receptor 2 [Eumeta japonica]|uniref:C-type mannose receptor 2 n=1 Tax=Eumeta variegata TaxID=151549 RepID=A0A4C1UXR2_EUMVA|nr:C-type mannose receptor 2 [Eumeta japonica]
MISFICLLSIVAGHASSSPNGPAEGLVREGLSADETVSAYYRSDYKYNDSIKGWYKVHEIPTSWLDARKRCSLEESILMSPVDEGHAAVMTQETAKPQIRMAFTGISSFLSPGLFVSYEGIPLQKPDHTWSDGQPKVLNRNKEAACIAIEKTGQLTIINCSAILPFLCFKQYKRLEAADCGSAPGYEYEVSADKCYRVYVTPKKWSDALAACAADRGQLAVVSGEAEADVVEGYFKNKDVYDLWGDTLLVGVHSLYEKAEWLTVHGQS